MDQKTWLWRKRSAHKSIDSNTEAENEAEVFLTPSITSMFFVRFLTSFWFNMPYSSTCVSHDHVDKQYI